MFRYEGGQNVGQGTYWNITDRTVVPIVAKGLFSRDDSAKYTSVPPSIVLLAGPVIGLFYIIVLPFMTLITIVALLGEKPHTGLSGILGSLVPFRWRPDEAYLTGKKRGNEE